MEYGHEEYFVICYLLDQSNMNLQFHHQIWCDPTQPTIQARPCPLNLQEVNKLALKRIHEKHFITFTVHAYSCVCKFISVPYQRSECDGLFKLNKSKITFFWVAFAGVIFMNPCFDCFERLTPFYYSTSKPSFDRFFDRFSLQNRNPEHFNVL